VQYGFHNQSGWKLKGKNLNNAIILLGSNIDPEKNIFLALDLLGKVKNKSHIWRTESFGTKGPDFLNMAVEIDTDMDCDQLKQSMITCIERTRHWIRTDDKNAPRTIDLDTIIFNGEVVDEDVWNKAFVAIPVSELSPNLIKPDTGEALLDIAEKMKSSAKAELFLSDE